MSAFNHHEIAKGNKALAAYYYQRTAALGSKDAMMVLKDIFLENPSPVYNLGYIPDPEQAAFYAEIDRQLDANKGITFPNLMKDHPLPRHPTQGYNADNPDVRPTN